jgi:hypothetical protein
MGGACQLAYKYKTVACSLTVTTLSWSSVLVFLSTAIQASWPCHAASNCIKGGQHSGFQWGCITFSGDDHINKLNLCFQFAGAGIPLDAIAQHYSLVPNRDIIIANLGVHLIYQGRSDERLQLLRDVLQRYQNSALPLPIVIYRETSPQHFTGHRGGFYEAEKLPSYTSCVETIDISLVCEKRE